MQVERSCPSPVVNDTKEVSGVRETKENTDRMEKCPRTARESPDDEEPAPPTPAPARGIMCSSSAKGTRYISRLDGSPPSLRSRVVS